MNRNFFCWIAAAALIAPNLPAQEKPVAPLVFCCEAVPPVPPRSARPVARESRPAENLSPEQRAKVRTAGDELRQQQAPLYEKLRAARKELEHAVQSPDLNEPLIRQKAAALGQIEGDLALVRAKHYQSLRGVIHGEQDTTKKKD